MTNPTAGGPTAEIVPFPVDAIRPAVPRVGGTLRGMICGRPVAGPITAKHHSFMAAGLVEGLEPTGRSFYFREARWDATEFWLPVVELAQPVRVLDWPHWPTPEHPVAFGAGTLPAEVVAPDEPPRIGGTLRAMIGGKVYVGPVDKEPASCVRGDLVELLQPTGRILWFEENKRCAEEYLLPVIGLRWPIRAVAWEIPEPVRFGSGVLRHRPALARALPSATILPFASSRPAHSRAIQ